MPYRFIKTSGEESWIKISGKFTVQDYLSLQSQFKKSIEQYGRIRLLIELDNFQGWSNDTHGWESTSFLLDDREKLSKMAFVGESKWHDDIVLFIGKPLRDMAIEYFPPDQLAEAQAWVFEQN